MAGTSDFGPDLGGRMKVDCIPWINIKFCGYTVNLHAHTEKHKYTHNYVRLRLSYIDY